MIIGVQIAEPGVRESIAAIERAESLGIQAAWMILGGAMPDTMAIFAVAATRTERIKLGTSIVPLYQRHPSATAGTARVVAELAPGRFRLGVGPSHRTSIEGGLGIPYDHPVSRLREYVQVLKAMLQKGGTVDFRGQFYQATLQAGQPIDIPVMASALREKSYRLAGEEADGGISWVTPLSFIEQSAIPAMAAAAASAGRQRPPMVMHVPVAVHEDAAEAREAAVRGLAFYPRLTNYQEMLAASGYPEAREGAWSQGMLDAVVVHGNEQTVAERLRQIAAAGVDEVICTVIPAGSDPQASKERTLRLLGEIGPKG